MKLIVISRITRVAKLMIVEVTKPLAWGAEDFAVKVFSASISSLKSLSTYLPSLLVLDAAVISFFSSSSNFLFAIISFT